MKVGDSLLNSDKYNTNRNLEGVNLGFGILTLITALSISAVAIYYSVAGLVAIFAAAALPIMVMGGVLEVGKLVTAVWLHRYWGQATWWLKTYLSTAVLVLMLITSMGIFGFLSKAHIEQTSASEESIARVEQIQTEIDRQLVIVGRAENRIREIESAGVGSDAQIQAQIDKEQERIDTAYTRIQPAIDEQNAIIKGQTSLYQDQIDTIDKLLLTVQEYIAEGTEQSIKQAQTIIGTRADGNWGGGSARQYRNWQEDQSSKRSELVTRIEEVSQNNTAILGARNEIRRLRSLAEEQISQSNNLINRLRNQLGNVDVNEIQTAIDEQQERVRTASNEIEKLTEEKYSLEAEYRKLEAEVGPIKYIAEFIYGEQADKNMLEEAVRWVIITIIFVFDPLAVLLLIASQYTFAYTRQNPLPPSDGGNDDPETDPDDPEPNDDEEELVEDYDKMQESILDKESSKNEETNRENTKNTEEGIQASGETQDEESVQRQDEIDQTLAGTEEAVGDLDKWNKMLEEAERAVAEEKVTVQEALETDNALDKSIDVNDDPKKKTVTSSITEESTEKSKLTEQQFEEREKDPRWQLAKSRWKEENPDQTIHIYKKLYLEDTIDELPWSKYVQTTNFITKDANKQQVKLQAKKEIDRIKPDLTTVTEPNSYIQNEEQDEKSLWRRIKE